MKPYIPTIHVDSKDHDTTVKAVRNACLESGFFYVAGHGIATSGVFEQMKSFFELPVNEKKHVVNSTYTRGYTAMREETLDPSKQTTGDTKEGFYIQINDIPVDDPLYDPLRFIGPNEWPDSIRCPSMKDPGAFKTTMKTYLDQVMSLALSITRLIAESLGLPPNYFDAAFETEPMATLRLLHYEATRSDTDAGIYACGAHSDYGMVTILLTDENDGLQIYDKRGCQEWVAVPTIPGCFVVNLGDMLEQWTNGMYCSTLHRVINTNGKERYSAPFFLDPSYDTVVECLDVCCSSENPARYSPITSGEYVLSKYKYTRADFS
jgi:isopenicillin N synthase-like dioxygenase